MLALEEENFEVLNLGVGKQNSVITKKVLGLVRSNEHIKTSV